MIGNKLESQGILDYVLGEVNNMDPLAYVPHEKKREGEIEVGLLEDLELRKLYSLGSFYAKETELLRVELKFSSDDNEERESTMYRYHRYSKLLSDLFWLGLDVKMGYKTEIIGLRAGWVVVDRAKAPDYQMELQKRRFGGMMGGIFGGFLEGGEE